MTHELKILPGYFEKVVSGEKTFEIRKNDRDFEEGDTLLLKEWDQITEQYTGREIGVVITYILDDETYLQPDYVALGIK